MRNLILDTDSYKASHHLMYPPDVDGAIYYLEARMGGRYDRTVFFGLQYMLMEHFCGQVTAPDVLDAAEFFAAHGEPFPREGWMRVVERYGGHLPIRIRAVPEGCVVPAGNVLMTVEATDPELHWLPGWLETQLVRVWYPTTVATRSWHAKQIIARYLHETCDAPDDLLRFRLHDFGGRGASSRESAMIGGAAHLVNFQGSDTVAGVVCANRYYGAQMAAFSVPAAEHSAILAWGKDGEADAYRHILARFAKPGAVVSIVSDTYDVDRAIRELWGGALRQQVVESGAVVVIRLDSGDPGPALVHALRACSEAFGSATNSKGYRVLKRVRLLWGDGLRDEHVIDALLGAVKSSGYSTENIATLGMGGGLIQMVNRDDCRFAFKCCRVRRGGTWHPVSKTVASDPSKASKAGDLDLVMGTNNEGRMTYCTIDRGQPGGTLLQRLHGDSLRSELRTVYANGEMRTRWTLDEVRERAQRP